MKNYIGFVLVALLLTPVIGAAPPQHAKGTDAGLPWAYGFTSAAGAPDPAAPPPAQPVPDDGTLRHLPTSGAAFNLTQIRDAFGPADWYPSDHPSMPDVVAHGRKPEVRACGLCHYPNGKGRPENAGVAGLPTAYFIQQMADFKSGARKSWDTRKANTNLMIAFAKAMTDDEVKASAEYFGAMKWTPWIKVVETKTVPKTRIPGGMFLRVEGSETEPIGERIIEMPVNTEGTELLRDARSGFVAYAPLGSIKKGEALVTTGGAGKTIQCGICHGPDLKGLANIPPLAGRSPSYLARQLYDIQHGTRTGINAQLMQKAVANLNGDDIVAITAYVASLAP